MYDLVKVFGEGISHEGMSLQVEIMTKDAATTSVITSVKLSDN